MADQYAAPAGGEHQSLPGNLALALFVAGLFQRLGGCLLIDGGRRSVWCPMPGHFGLEEESLPQLPDAKPWERFHSDDEWYGALKVARYWLVRLNAADKNFVFTLSALASDSLAGDFDFRSYLRA